MADAEKKLMLYEESKNILEKIFNQN
jgi:hypothetical protein